MTREINAYKTWAPPESLWSPWAKPVLFASGLKGTGVSLDRPEAETSTAQSQDQPAFDRSKLDWWIPPVIGRTMVIIDLPGKSGLVEGLAAARYGYRPVPLYNGVCGPAQHPMIVPVREIVSALFQGAEELATLNLRPEAPPAFLLDSGRMPKVADKHGTFDNRWCIFPQDLPSAQFLIGRGIEQILLRAASIADDLNQVLWRYQEAGLKIKQCYNLEVKEVRARKPDPLKALIYRFSVILGLNRHTGGGFGELVPFASQGGSGRRGFG